MSFNGFYGGGGGRGYSNDDDDYDDHHDVVTYYYYFFLLFVALAIFIVTTCCVHRRYNQRTGKDYWYLQFRWLFSCCGCVHDDDAQPAVVYASSAPTNGSNAPYDTVYVVSHHPAAMTTGAYAYGGGSGYNNNFPPPPAATNPAYMNNADYGYQNPSYTAGADSSHGGRNNNSNEVVMGVVFTTSDDGTERRRRREGNGGGGEYYSPVDPHSGAGGAASRHPQQSGGVGEVRHPQHNSVVTSHVPAFVTNVDRYGYDEAYPPQTAAANSAAANQHNPLPPTAEADGSAYRYDTQQRQQHHNGADGSGAGALGPNYGYTNSPSPPFGSPKKPH